MAGSDYWLLYHKATPLLIYSASDWLAFCVFSNKKLHPLPSDESIDGFVVRVRCAKHNHLVIRLEKGSSSPPCRSEEQLWRTSDPERSSRGLNMVMCLPGRLQHINCRISTAWKTAHRPTLCLILKIMLLPHQHNQWRQSRAGLASNVVESLSILSGLFNPDKKPR